MVDDPPTAREIDKLDVEYYDGPGDTFVVQTGASDMVVVFWERDRRKIAHALAKLMAHVVDPTAEDAEFRTPSGQYFRVAAHAPDCTWTGRTDNGSAVTLGAGAETDTDGEDAD